MKSFTDATFNKGDIFEAFITKYALTKGVSKIKVEYVGDGVVRSLEFRYSFYNIHQWHLSELDTETQVFKMINSKRKSIRKQLVKLEELRRDILKGLTE